MHPSVKDKIIETAIKILLPLKVFNHETYNQWLWLFDAS